MEPLELLRHVVEIFERLHIPYFVTGSMASMAYGEPRLTNDIDIVAEIGARQVADLVTAFPGGEFYISSEMIGRAIERRGQFHIIHPVSGLKVDVMMCQDSPFDRSRFFRIRRISPARSYQANFASPEDVILKKMEYYREGGSEKHLRDITGMLKISGAEIDDRYIVEWANRLGVVDIWTAIQGRLKDQP